MCCLHSANSFTTSKMIPYIIIINFLLCMASQILLPTRAAMATGSEADRLALLALKDKLTNGIPEALPSWNDSVHFCKWQGVSCSLRHMRVLALHLTNQDLGGTLAPVLGKIPFGFGYMHQLEVLALNRNEFAGPVPPSLGNLSSLETLALAYNNLEGHLPQSLGRLSNLKSLFLSHNNFFGIIPPSLYNLSRMDYFDLPFNYLSGAIPLNIDIAFPNLRYFNVGHNLLRGTIPISLSNISQLQLFAIYENAFSGLVPTSFGRLQNLRKFEIDANNFGSDEGHDLDFLSSLTNCSQLNLIEMLDNKFRGVLPNSIGNLSSQLDSLSMGFNHIFGSIPNEIGQLDGLTYLVLEHNFLQGTIPHSIGKLGELGKLALGDNQLCGRIPDFFGNLTKLLDLELFNNNFEGTIPISIKHCKGMQSLYLNQNNLSGNIPNQTFGPLESLLYLDMSSNSLTGPIPFQIGNMKQLVKLKLSQNNFFSDIPMELGGCLQLTNLDMSNNFLHGSIPSSFSSLKSLISLDLSNNNLSGKIPQELNGLSILKTLNLSHNHFFGEVPKGGVFDNVTAISLTGNGHLCGGIPQLKLPKCPKKKKEHFKVKILIIVTSGVLACFAMCLVIICMRRKYKKLSSSPSSPQNIHLRVSYKELHDATNGFSSSNLVGVGSFGSVYKGTLQHFERPIAVKVLNLEAHGASKSFITECKTLSKVRHRNLLKILTSCSSIDYKGNSFKALVFEFMSNESLENWLSTNEWGEPRNLNFAQRLDIAVDVAHALDYIHHDFEEVIVHCDIKPSNVLLDDDMVAHLGDFGLARLFHEAASYSSEGQTTSSAIKGTIGYIPPEYGESGQVTTQGDIFSYGVLLLEMLTGKKPTDNMFSGDLSLSKYCKLALPDGVLEIVDSSLLVLSDRDHKKIMQNSDMERNIQEFFASFAKIGVACCEKFPGQRIGIKDALAELLTIKQKLSTFNIAI
ncbi:probable LRR receptor-like serine/threonine-protein kinase At3g47570 isoform X2 [Prosopis cineraria]|uniref:probable LRR receptor-like serine/threonine-protein kinase At3g47570 isoform X2 n=1 Tax=Prosopis cineraria TaxID=364024 RepID=UPI0024109A22|nr:probable LRR receptor-like serine/threonine-protein kinase At3g47570 isoform X2 [Prosopis cineraria]